MANKKVKRYNGYDGSAVYEDDTNPDPVLTEEENARNNAIANEMRGEEILKNARDKTSATKAPIVTKKQLADSGYDNLRDYLNAQKGLTRRGESTPRAPQNAPAKATPAQGGSGRGGQGGATADELEAYGKQRAAQKQAEYEAAKAKAATPEGRAEREAKVKGQALEAVRPEENLIGGGAGGALKGIAALARNLANRKGASALAEYSVPQLEAARKALPAPQRLLGMKKGGSVKASKMSSVKTAKPSTSSASRRGDGIATKGKTRGRLL